MYIVDLLVIYCKKPPRYFYPFLRALPFFSPKNW